MPTDNRQLALQWMEDIWNRRIDETIDRLMAPDAVGHACGAPDLRGPAGFRAFRDPFLRAIPELRLEVQDSVAEGDNVVLRWRVQGRHTGEGLGVAPQGKPVDVWGVTWMRFVDGRLVEGWDAWNPGVLMQQLA